MTQDQWNTCCDPAELLGFLRKSGKVSERKLRLFAVACWYLYLGNEEDTRYRAALAISEKYADGVATKRELAKAHNELHAWVYCVREAKTLWGQAVLGVLATALPSDDWIAPEPIEKAFVSVLHRKASRAASVVVRAALK